MAPGSSLPQFVFGYGSLLRHARRGSASGERIVRLDGLRRTWNVAMDNAVDLPGYKYYRDLDGGRPPVSVTFLNLMPAPGHRVNGVVFAVAAEDLPALDRRERNYERFDVTHRVVGDALGTVWTYLGTEDARERYERGLSAGRAVVSREYHDGVVQDFTALGSDALDQYLATTDPPVCPIVELERVDLPAQPTP